MCFLVGNVDIVKTEYNFLPRGQVHSRASWFSNSTSCQPHFCALPTSPSPSHTPRKMKYTPNTFSLPLILHYHWTCRPLLLPAPAGLEHFPVSCTQKPWEQGSGCSYCRFMHCHFFHSWSNRMKSHTHPNSHLPSWSRAATVCRVCPAIVKMYI